MNNVFKNKILKTFCLSFLLNHSIGEKNISPIQEVDFLTKKATREYFNPKNKILESLIIFSTFCAGTGFLAKHLSENSGIVDCFVYGLYYYIIGALLYISSLKNPSYFLIIVLSMIITLGVIEIAFEKYSLEDRVILYMMHNTVIIINILLFRYINYITRSEENIKTLNKVTSQIQAIN